MNKCIDCNKKIRLTSKRCNLCSVKYFWKTHPEYKIIKSCCIDCRKKLSRSAYYQKNKRCKSCEDKRRHKLGILDSHLANYKDGRTGLQLLIRQHENMKEWRLKIYKRDRYVCQQCHIKTKELHAHHKIPLSIIFDLYFIKTLEQALKCKLLWDINWGITLCKKCHGELTIGKNQYSKNWCKTRRICTS